MTAPKQRFAVCIKSGSYEASLEPRKIYRVLDDPAAEAKSLLRVIDDSGEDYLYPVDLFVPIRVPASVMPLFATEMSGSR